MTAQDQQRLGKTLWAIADQLRGAMNADDLRDYMLAFLFLRYLFSMAWKNGRNIFHGVEMPDYCRGFTEFSKKFQIVSAASNPCKG